MVSPAVSSLASPTAFLYTAVLEKSFFRYGTGRIPVPGNGTGNGTCKVFLTLSKSESSELSQKDPTWGVELQYISGKKEEGLFCNSAKNFIVPV